MTNEKIACVIPTYNGRNDVERLLSSLATQTILPQIFIVDSSSTDGTFDVALSSNHQAISIPSSQFNHGGTRQMMIDINSEYDIFVFLTQDAYLEDSKSLSQLVSAFSDPQVGAVCGRQLPHHDAVPLARHARAFNYPSASSVKEMDDVPELGLKAAFISNSFAAYRREALESVGGFPKHVIFAEDMYVAAKMLLHGWKVAYSGDACCRHSHNYTIGEEFSRYFDMGVFHAREPWIRQQFGSAGGEGLRYVVSEIKYLGLRNSYLWPTSIIRNICKLVGYKMGQNESLLPTPLKKKLGMYKRYWDSPYAEKSE